LYERSSFKLIKTRHEIILINNYISFEAFAAVMFQFEIFWVVPPCSVVTGYQRFGCPCCFHLHYTTSQLRKPRHEIVTYMNGTTWDTHRHTHFTSQRQSVLKTTATNRRNRIIYKLNFKVSVACGTHKI
jgi:hypothetical protein